MLQDSLRSAVYRSLTKPLADGCQNEKNQTVAVACRTHTLSKTSHSNSNYVQGKGHQVLEEKKAMEQRDKGELTRSTDFLSNSSKDLDESMAMLCNLQEASSKKMSHSKPRQKREEILLEKDCIEDIMSSRRFLNQEPRLSVDGSSRNYTEKQLRRRMTRLKYIDEDFGVSERMSLRRFGVQAQRHSVDGSAEQVQRMSQLFQLKQRSEFLEQDIGVEERMKPRFSFDGRLMAERFKLQEPRFSAGWSCSIDSIEELRRVIKYSLCQQNLLSRSPEDERACIEQSLSPWRGSRFERFKNLCNDDAEWRLPSSSVSATPQAKTAKGPNLIAKLMGLEEAPLQTIDPIKKEEKKRGSNVPRLNSDIERPTARKLQLVEKKKKKKAGLKQKSLQEIIEAMQFKGLLKSGQFDEPRIKQLEHYGRNFRRDDESLPIVIMKPLYLPQWERGEVQKCLLLDKSLVNDEILNADLIQEKRVSDGKEVKTIEKAKVDFSTASRKQQAKEPFKTRKTAQERQKPVVDVTTIEEKKIPVKAERMSISQFKCDKRLSTAKNKVSQVKPEAKKNSANSLKEKKIPRRKSDSKSIDIQMDDKSCKNRKETNPVRKMDTFSDTTLPADKIILEMETDPKTYEKDVVKEDQEPNCEVMPKTSQAKKIPELSKEVIHLPVTKPAARKEVVVEDDLMRLLLSSQSFLTRAQELYAIDASQLVYHQTKSIGDDVMRNAKLYLDCGLELTARNSHQHELMMYPISGIQMWDLTASFTLHQLAEEIGSRVRTLTSYIKVDRSITSNDVLYLRLERDLRHNDVVGNAMWDIGWLNWGYPEEAVQLVCEVEESILSLLVAEVATEFG